MFRIRDKNFTFDSALVSILFICLIGDSRQRLDSFLDSESNIPSGDVIPLAIVGKPGNAMKRYGFLFVGIRKHIRSQKMISHHS